MNKGPAVFYKICNPLVAAVFGEKVMLTTEEKRGYNIRH